MLKVSSNCLLLTRAVLFLCASVTGNTWAAPGKDLPDIKTVPADLKTPLVENGKPAPGKRVKMVAPDYRGTDVYHALYLPTDW